MIIFYYKWVFLLLFAPLLLRLKSSRQTPKHKALKIPFFNDISEIKTRGSGKYISRMTFLKLLIWTIWICLVIAAARPQIIGERIEIEQEARTIILVLDSSGSMQEQDFTINGKRTSRFEVMKQVVGDFIKERTGDKIGIVLFGTHAYIYSPPTDDTETLLYLLDTAQLGLVGGNTAIGDGIGMAVKMTQDLPEENRIAILLSDGLSNTGFLRDEDAIELAKKAQMKIYTIAMGMNFSADFFGLSFSVKSEVNDEALTKIAQETGGKFYSAGNTKELADVYEQINQQEPIKDESKFFRPTKDIFYIPLSLAFITSIFMFLLITKKRGKNG